MNKVSHVLKTGLLVSLYLVMTACSDTKNTDIQNIEINQPSESPTSHVEPQVKPLVSEQDINTSKLPGRWQLESIDGQAVLIGQGLVRRDNLTFRLDSDNSGGIYGNDGCNRTGATFWIMDDKIRFKAGPKQLRPCNTPPENVDYKYQPILYGNGTFKVDETSLIITIDDKQYALTRLPEDWKIPARSNLNEDTSLPTPLPPLPKNQALCEIRDARPGEKFPDYPKSEFPEYGYSVIGSNETLMWDHQAGFQGSVGLADGKDVLFENEAGLKVLRKLSSYATSASFGPRGLYCTHYSEDIDRFWPYFFLLEQTDIPPSIDRGVKSQIINENYCLRIKPNNGDIYTPIFTSKSIVGYDDFGFYLKDYDGVKKRIDDVIQSKPAGAVLDKSVSNDYFKVYANNCPEPLRIYVQ